MFKKIIRFVKGLFRKHLYYLHSKDMLPPPLSAEEEAELVQKAMEKDKEAIDLLVVHNLRLVVFIAKKYDSPKASLEDLISIGSMGLIKGVRTFKPDKNIKLATYASRCIENEILMFLRKTQKMICEVSLDETLNVDAEGNELQLIDILYDEDDDLIENAIRNDEIEFMYNAIAKLDVREKELMVLRYGLNGEMPLTQKEVAELLNISQSYISRLEKRIIDKLRQSIFQEMKVVNGNY